MNNLRIYSVISTFLPLIGGAETQTFAQSASLHERGCPATIVTFRYDKTWPAREEIGDVPVIRVAGTLLGGREKLPRFLQKLLFLLANLVLGWTLWRHRHRYDVLQVCQVSLLTLPAALVCRITGKRLVIVVVSSGSSESVRSHNDVSLIAGPLDATMPWLKVDGQTWVDGDLEALEGKGKFILKLIRSLLQSIRAEVVVLSSRMKSYLVSHDFYLSGVHHISNGVDTQRFQYIHSSNFSDEQYRTVVCVSKLRYEKGIDVLLQAWRLVREQYPQARLILVGSGPLETQLERMAEALEITDSIEFAGLQSDVAAQLHRGSIAVLPSRWEGMPNALLEAMACGLACIATRVSGSEDAIDHGINGLLVEPEDYQGMAQALLTLLCDPVLVEKYGQAARATAEKDYSLEHIVDSYIALYQRITGLEVQNLKDRQPSELYPLSS